MPLLNARYPCTDDQSESFTTTNKEFRIKMNHRRACVLLKAIKSSFNVDVQPVIDARTDDSDSDDIEEEFYDEEYSDEEEDIAEEDAVENSVVSMHETVTMSTRESDSKQNELVGGGRGDNKQNIVVSLHYKCV